MEIPLKITFRDMPPSKAIETNIRERAAAARAPNQELEKDLVENHKPSKHAAHEDAYVAIRDAFNAAERKLKDFARRRRGQVKAHEGSATARVARLFPIEDYGFLETTDGREIYFHKNSVMAPGFDRLEVGTEVLYSEAVGKRDHRQAQCDSLSSS